MLEILRIARTAYSLGVQRLAPNIKTVNNSGTIRTSAEQSFDLPFCVHPRVLKW